MPYAALIFWVLRSTFHMILHQRNVQILISIFSPSQCSHVLSFINPFLFYIESTSMPLLSIFWISFQYIQLPNKIGLKKGKTNCCQSKNNLLDVKEIQYCWSKSLTKQRITKSCNLTNILYKTVLKKSFISYQNIRQNR